MDPIEPKEEIKIDAPVEPKHSHTLADDMVSAEVVSQARHNILDSTKPLHTLSSDLANALHEKKGSVIKLALAEEEKKRMIAEGAQSGSKQDIFFMVMSGVLILGGIGLVAFLLFKKMNTTPPVQPTTFPNFIFTDGTIALPLIALDTQTTLKDIATAFTTVKPTEMIDGIYPTTGIADNAKLISLDAFTKKLNITTPPDVVKYLSPIFMLGANRSKDAIQPFMILKTISYDDASTAMTAWEPTMYESLNKVFSPTTDVTLVGRDFADGIIYNKDARILRADDGTIIFYYSFLDKNTVLIATHVETIPVVMERLLTQ
jgi:hypothetical protein